LKIHLEKYIADEHLRIFVIPLIFLFQTVPQPETRAKNVNMMQGLVG
jgi:hypothetical protein